MGFAAGYVQTFLNEISSVSWNWWSLAFLLLGTQAQFHKTRLVVLAKSVAFILVPLTLFGVLAGEGMFLRMLWLLMFAMGIPLAIGFALAQVLIRLEPKCETLTRLLPSFEERIGLMAMRLRDRLRAKRGDET